MAGYGLTREQLAATPVKNRRHAALNPIAQIRKPISVQDVLEARPIVRPLGLLDVPPRSDGAVAIVVSTPPRGGSVATLAALLLTAFHVHPGDGATVTRTG